MFTVLLVILILGFLIVIHELGHFIAAKYFGVRVEEFGVGYPPRAFTFGKWGDTEYTLNWIPFGGFVRLFGDVGDERQGKGSFIDKSRGVQAVILVAGVFMNAVAAWVLFTGALYVGVPRVVEQAEPGVPQSLLVAEVVPGSPADVAGIAVGDIIVSITGRYEETLLELTPDTVSDFISARGGEEITFSYVRADTTETVTMRPAHAVIPEEAERPAVGVALVIVSTQPIPFVQAMKEGFISTGNAFRAVAFGLGNIVKDAVSGKSAFKDVVGPVGLVSVVGVAAESGVGNLLALAAFISINLVIINLLPIPALDGGRLFLLGIETVIRRSAPRIALRLMNAVGIAFILLLMVTVTYNDIARLLS